MVANGGPSAQSTDFTKPLSTTGTTAGRQTTGVVNCTKSGSAAGESASNGGTSTGVAGIATATGMIATMIAISGVELAKGGRYVRRIERR